jgi:hypothetical protein
MRANRSEFVAHAALAASRGVRRVSVAPRNARPVRGFTLWQALRAAAFLAVAAAVLPSFL